jgi:hypothetical protein
MLRRSVPHSGSSGVAVLPRVAPEVAGEFVHGARCVVPAMRLALMARLEAAFALPASPGTVAAVSSRSAAAAPTTGVEKLVKPFGATRSGLRRFGPSSPAGVSPIEWAPLITPTVIPL